MSRCVSTLKAEGRSPEKAKEMCAAMWYKAHPNSEEIITFQMEASMSMNTCPCGGIENSEDAGKEKSYTITAVIGDRFMNGGFLSASELEKCYQSWENTLHDINHQGTTMNPMTDPRPDIRAFVGYHTNVHYNQETKEVTMDLHIVESTMYAEAWKGFIDLCKQAGITPNVSVTYMGRRKYIQAKNLPNGVDYKAQGYSENDYVPYLINVRPVCVSTVLLGKCSDKDGCGFNCNISPSGESDDNSESNNSEQEEEKQELIKWHKNYNKEEN